MGAEDGVVMSEARLAEIRVKAYDAYDWDDWKARAMLGDLLTEHERMAAEVERLRAREAALKSHVDESINDVLQSILESGGLPPELFPLDHARVTVSSIYERLQQARAVLASERSGGDGR